MGSSDLLCNMKTYILTMASYTVKTCEDIHKGKTAGNATFTDLKSDYMVILISSVISLMVWARGSILEIA